MQPIQFPCAACSELMAVPTAFQGRNVRCPNCKAIVLAPTAATLPQEAVDRSAELVASTKGAPAIDLLGAPVGVSGPGPVQLPAIPPNKRGGVPTVLVLLLGLYALLATIAAIYFALFQPKPKADPFESMPDVYGEYRRATSDRQRMLWESLPGPSEALPEHLKIPLGQTLRVHDLEITPLRVTSGEPEYFRRHRGDLVWGEPRVMRYPVMLLYLRLRNCSPSNSFYPMDPAFTRREEPADPSAPYTRLEIGGKTFCGPFRWPSKRFEYRAAGQEQDYEALGPGQERDTVVLTRPGDKAVQAVRESPGDSLLWRVHLRSGRLAYRGQWVTVTSVIGVVFQRDQVEWPEST